MLIMLLRIAQSMMPAVRLNRSLEQAKSPAGAEELQTNTPSIDFTMGVDASAAWLESSAPCTSNQRAPA